MKSDERAEKLKSRQLDERLIFVKDVCEVRMVVRMPVRVVLKMAVSMLVRMVV